jgi:hypothetical protein
MKSDALYPRKAFFIKLTHKYIYKYIEYIPTRCYSTNVSRPLIKIAAINKRRNKNQKEINGTD